MQTTTAHDAHAPLAMAPTVADRTLRYALRCSAATIIMFFSMLLIVDVGTPMAKKTLPFDFATSTDEEHIDLKRAAARR